MRSSRVRGNGVGAIGGGHEQHPRQVKGNIEVMVGKRPIVIRIQDFQERRRRIAAKIAPHLVDFIQHEHRIVGAGRLDPLNDTTGQSPQIGAPMTANLALHPVVLRARSA